MSDELDLKMLRDVASKATPGFWGKKWHGNYPFYVVVTKPAPSLSKHDHERPEYWRMEDGNFVASFCPEVALKLLDRIEELENKNKENK